MMNSNTINGTMTNQMQLRRIQEHPFHVYQTDENAAESFLINDNLEEGNLEVYENLGGILTLQQLTALSNPANAVLVAKINIGALWQDEGILVHRISCDYGYEYLVKPIIEQVVHFATFYDCFRSVRLSERERECWFLYAGGILADFHKKGRTYIYHIR